MHSASCIATFVVQELHLTRCRICDDTKRAVINDRLCTKCEEFIRSRRQTMKWACTKEDLNNFAKLNETQNMTDEELKCAFLDNDQKEYEKELEEMSRRPKRKKTFVVPYHWIFGCEI